MKTGLANFSDHFKSRCEKNNNLHSNKTFTKIKWHDNKKKKILSYGEQCFYTKRKKNHNIHYADFENNVIV